MPSPLVRRQAGGAVLSACSSTRTLQNNDRAPQSSGDAVRLLIQAMSRLLRRSILTMWLLVPVLCMWPAPLDVQPPDTEGSSNNDITFITPPDYCCQSPQSGSVSETDATSYDTRSTPDSLQKLLNWERAPRSNVISECTDRHLFERPASFRGPVDCRKCISWRTLG